MTVTERVVETGATWSGVPRPAAKKIAKAVAPKEQSTRRTSERRWSLKSFGVGAAVGGLAVGALLFLPSKIVDTGSARGEVVKVVPAELDERAVVTAKVEADVKRNAGGALGWVLKHTYLQPTFQMDSRFTGPNGTGGGEISTEVKVKRLGVRTIPEPNGKQEVVIPASDIVFTSIINEGMSQVREDNGDLHNIGATEWAVSPFDTIKNRIAQNQSDLDQVARAEAVNYMQTSCDSAAWPAAEKAITQAYRNIAENDYQIEKAAGVNVQAFHPNDLSVVITGGTPAFPKVYQFNKSANYQFNEVGISACTIDSRALNLHDSSQS